jgi:hypothetical protein
VLEERKKRGADCTHDERKNRAKENKRRNGKMKEGRQRKEGCDCVCIEASAEERKTRKKEWKYERRNTRNVALGGRRQQRQHCVNKKDGRQVR